MHTFHSPSLRRRPFLCSTYLAKAQRLLLGERALIEAAQSSIEIAPSSRNFHPQPVFAPDNLHRITGVGAGTTLDHEQGQTVASWRTHQATVAHRLRSLFLIDGSFYAKRFKHGVSVNNGPLLAAGMATQIQGGVLAQSWLGTKYFGHWLLEDITLGLLAGRRGEPLGVPRPLTQQQSEYAQFFRYRTTTLPNVAHVENIEILSDSGLNPAHIDRLQSLRDLYIESTKNCRHTGVFLMRGSTGESRQLINEAEVAEFMARQGFKVINPGTTSMQQVRAAVANANMVVGVEGSQLAHGVMGLATGGALLVLQPPARFNNAFKERCDLLGLTYAFMVCNEAADGFTADLDALARLMDRVQRHVLSS